MAKKDRFDKHFDRLSAVLSVSKDKLTASKKSFGKLRASPSGKLKMSPFGLYFSILKDIDGEDAITEEYGSMLILSLVEEVGSSRTRLY